MIIDEKTKVRTVQYSGMFPTRLVWVWCRIRIVLISNSGSGSVPKCFGSGTRALGVWRSFIIPSSSVADPDPVGSGRFIRIRKFHHQIRIRIQLWQFLKKYLFLCNIVHMYIYLLRRCDSSIGIGKATRHDKFNNDEIGFCLVLGIVCHSMYQYQKYILYFWNYQIHFTQMNMDPVLTGSGSGLFSEVGSGSGPNRSGSATLPSSTQVEGISSENFYVLVLVCTYTVRKYPEIVLYLCCPEKKKSESLQSFIYLVLEQLKV